MNRACVHALRNHDARVLGLAAKNWNKSEAIYRGFRYGLVENLETAILSVIRLQIMKITEKSQRV
jgi:hypothetical protein